MPSAPISVSGSGANEIVAAPGAGKIIRVFGFSLSSNGTVNAKWQSAANDLTGLYYFNQFAHVERWSDQFLFDCNANEALNLNLSAGIAVGGEVTYTILNSSAS